MKFPFQKSAQQTFEDGSNETIGSYLFLTKKVIIQHDTERSLESSE